MWRGRGAPCSLLYVEGTKRTEQGNARMDRVREGREGRGGGEGRRNELQSAVETTQQRDSAFRKKQGNRGAAYTHKNTNGERQDRFGVPRSGGNCSARC